MIFFVKRSYDLNYGSLNILDSLLRKKHHTHVVMEIFRLFVCSQIYYAPPHRLEELSDDVCLTSVCLSHKLALKTRSERPRKTKMAQR